MAAVTVLSTNRGVLWLSFLFFFTGFVLFFVSYTGNNWYVTPYDHMAYPPDSPFEPVTMGLFWMCARGHCRYDLTVDYMVVKYIPRKETQDAFQNFRTACMAIETIAAVFCIAALALNLIVLSNFTISRMMGFVAAGSEFIAGIIALIGVILFGAKFRGTTNALPFGWSFWLMIAAFIVLILDGILTGLITTVGIFRVQKKSNEALTRPLASGF